MDKKPLWIVIKRLLHIGISFSSQKETFQARKIDMVIKQNVFYNIQLDRQNS